MNDRDRKLTEIARQVNATREAARRGDNVLTVPPLPVKDYHNESVCERYPTECP